MTTAVRYKFQNKEGMLQCWCWIWFLNNPAVMENCNNPDHGNLVCGCPFHNITGDSHRFSRPNPWPCAAPKLNHWGPRLSVFMHTLYSEVVGITTRKDGPIAVDMVTTKGWIEGTMPMVFQVVMNKVMIGTWRKIIDMLNSLVIFCYLENYKEYCHS